MEEITLTIENAPSFTRVFDIAGVSKKQVSINGDTIIMPVEFFRGIANLCSHQRETRGIMLCTKKGQIYQVWFVASLGQGTATSVFPDDRKRNALDKLVRNHGQDVVLIDWHTHTVSTGADFYNCFSSQDYTSLYNTVSQAGRNRMHVLFTPESVLTWGVNKPRFIVHDHPNPKAVESFNEWKARYDQYYLAEPKDDEMEHSIVEQPMDGGFLKNFFNFLSDF